MTPTQARNRSAPGKPCTTSGSAAFPFRAQPQEENECQHGEAHHGHHERRSQWQLETKGIDDVSRCTDLQIHCVVSVVDGLIPKVGPHCQSRKVKRATAVVCGSRTTFYGVAWKITYALREIHTQRRFLQGAYKRDELGTNRYIVRSKTQVKLSVSTVSPVVGGGIFFLSVSKKTSELKPSMNKLFFVWIVTAASLSFPPFNKKRAKYPTLFCHFFGIQLSVPVAEFWEAGSFNCFAALPSVVKNDVDGTTDAQ